MKDHTVRRYSLARQVADSLEKMIQDGIYQVGSKIPTEFELMDEFKVSRNTIREAVKALASAGVLEVRQGDGTYVKSNNRFDANMDRKYKEVDFEEMKEARKAFEISIAILAAMKRNDEDLENIRRALVNRTIGGVEARIIADIQFHKAIAIAAHNQIIFDLYKTIYHFVEDDIHAKHLEGNFDADEYDKLHELLYLAIKEQNVDNAIKYVKAILKF